jgi:hypothetical protein
MALGIVFLPKEDFSVTEKRSLAKLPEISLSRITDGNWESDFESYISDRFPARNFFAAADSYYTLYSGRNGAKGVYKGTDGYLINTPTECDDKKLEANISAVNDFAAKTGIKTKVMIVPETGYIMSDKLPALHEEYRDDEIMSKVKNMLDGAELIDLTADFKSVKDSAQLYYKTDHHWTSEGAYTAYSIWARGEGINPRERDAYTVETADGFYGTTYTKSALWNEKGDTLQIWRYPINVNVTINDGTTDAEYDSMFFEEQLKNLDKYPVFLNGNHAFERIVNKDNPNGKRVLLIKDSYAHCFAPFMAESCSVIDMVDLRYYFDSVSDMTKENEYDEVLVLFGISNICDANDLSILE